MGRILTTHNPPPIPVRDFDWQAVHEGYEPGAPIGYGRTERAAVEDLQEQTEEQAA